MGGLRDWFRKGSGAPTPSRTPSQANPAEAASQLVAAVESGPFEALVNAQRELIESGQAAAPVIADLLHHDDWEVRTHAAGAVTSVHIGNDSIAKALADALGAASEEEEIDTVLMAVQQSRALAAIPAIAAIIRNEDADEENLSLAIAVLGVLTEQHFEDADLDPREAALEYLGASGY